MQVRWRSFVNDQSRSRLPWFSIANGSVVDVPAVTVPASGLGFTTICGAPTFTVTESVLVKTCGEVGVHLMPELSVTAGCNAENWLNSAVEPCNPIVAHAPPVQSGGSVGRVGAVGHVRVFEMNRAGLVEYQLERRMIPIALVVRAIEPLDDELAVRRTAAHVGVDIAGCAVEVVPQRQDRRRLTMKPRAAMR